MKVDTSETKVTTNHEKVSKDRLDMKTSRDQVPKDVTVSQLFCEMDVLQLNSNDDNFEWKEVSRWVRFEEDVEIGGRWSKPRVATLPLHSLFELRSYIPSGVVLMDCDAESFDQVADEIVNQAFEKKMINGIYCDHLKSVLIARHVHQHEKVYREQLDIGETQTFPLVKSIADMRNRKKSTKDFSEYNNNDIVKTATQRRMTEPSNQTVTNPGAIAFADADETSPKFELNDSINKVNDFEKKEQNNEPLKPLEKKSSKNLEEMMYNRNYQANARFLKKVPRGAEAANILVGEVDFLDRHLSAFVRLSKSTILGDLTEIAIPTRFIFVVLGPKGNLPKYQEIARSMGALMVDDLFNDAAYTANSVDDIIQGVDEFLDQVTVLPPGEWHPAVRLNPPAKLLEKEERLQKLGKSFSRLNSIQKPKADDEDTYEAHHEDPALQRTGRLFGGLIQDIKRRAPWYLSDFKDALSFKCLSAILFLYFACLSPIITFGGLLSTATDKNMAAIESLVSGAVCGIMYHMFSGQPMTIVGSTGPVLVFETIVNRFSKENGIDYMGFRAWIGLWTMVILLIIVITDTSVLVKYITRFTEESFAVLIAFIFIRESFAKLSDIQNTYAYSHNPAVYEPVVANRPCYECQRVKNFYFGPYELEEAAEAEAEATIDGLAPVETIVKIVNATLRPRFNMTSNMTSNFTYLDEKMFLNYSEDDCKQLGADFEYIHTCKYVPDVFFFSIVLYLLTFFMALGLRNFKFTRFFPALLRSKISDFSVAITVICAVTLDYIVGIDTPKLHVPSTFRTTRPDRTWFINPIDRTKDDVWVIFAAIIPAILATILIFMDQHITAVIINRKQNKLKKGGGYHLDLLIVALSIGINSLLGIPWFVAATVLSINHIINLKVESETSAPGQKPKFLGVIEQRVTGTLVFILIGCSVFMAPLLNRIPMPVLYAIFLYMGVSSLREIQFMHRVMLLFMPEKYQPDYPYLRHVRTFKIHIFTLIQIGCLGLLFFIKMNKAISILFPIMVLALIFIRKIMDYLFTKKELFYLDDIMPPFTSKKNAIRNDDETGNIVESSVEKSKNSKIDLSNELAKTSIWKNLEKRKNDSEESSVPLMNNNNTASK